MKKLLNIMKKLLNELFLLTSSFLVTQGTHNNGA